MPTPPTANLRVIKYAEGWGYAASEWAQALRAVGWDVPHAAGGPERLKLKTLADGTRDCTVWRATLELGSGNQKRAHDVIIKLDPLNSVKKKVQALLRRTKAFRQWRGAEKIGQDAAQPFAVLRSSSHESLVLEAAAGLTLLETAAHGYTFAHEQRVAAEFGWTLGRLVTQGLTWPDMKASNMILEPPKREGERPSLRMVDTLGVGHSHRVHALFPMVAELVGTKNLPRRATLMRFATAFVREYANWEYTLSAHGEDGHEQWVRSARRTLWRDIEDGLASHGDPTPKDDPLARE